MILKLQVNIESVTGTYLRLLSPSPEYRSIEISKITGISEVDLKKYGEAEAEAHKEKFSYATSSVITTQECQKEAGAGAGAGAEPRL